MEPLSGVASGMAVVSLSLQLIQSVGTINRSIQGVKNAPKELVRLTGLLERLGAILKDVHDFLEKQSNAPDHVKTASATIESCLRSCEESLIPLQDIVEKYTRLQARNRSTTARLRADIRLSIKTKDIADLERRIHNEISNLTSAVVIASATSQMTTVVHMHAISQEANTPSAQQTTLAKRNDSSELYLTSPSWRVKQIAVQVPFVWRSIGLSKQRWLRYLRGGLNTDETGGDDVWETSEYLWSIPKLSYALQVRYSGYLMGSLAVFPIVQQFDESIDDLFRKGSLYEFQKQLGSGALHPFTRDRHGQSLMHYGRLDCCRVLTAHGLRPDLTHNGSGYSPLWYSLYLGRTSKRVVVDVVDAVDVLRYFLLDLDLVDNFDHGAWSYVMLRHDRDVIDWLWRSTSVLTDPEKLRFQEILLKELIHEVSLGIHSRALQTELDTVAAYLDSRLLNQIVTGEAGLLRDLFRTNKNAADSSLAGHAFIELLQRLGADPVTAISNELALIDRHILSGYWHGQLDKRVSFACHGRSSYELCWEYVFDDGDPSTPFLKEFTALTADASWGDCWEWPFSEPCWSSLAEDQESGYHRRMAKKALKEAARLGHKRSRRSMPGAWVS